MEAKKTVVLGVTGSVAAYKAVGLCSALVKKGVEVYPVLTQSAVRFVAPLSFESITHTPCAVDQFSRETPWEIEHIALAKRADVFAVMPATANFIGKYANGIADDLLTTVAMAVTAPAVLAPAMNSAMYLSPANQHNMKVLKERGVRFVEAESGPLACGDVGVGRLAGEEALLAAIFAALYPKRDFAGRRVLVTAGPTREPIDPVRYISNRSSGKMGYAIAMAARDRGAQVTLVTGPTALEAPGGMEVVRVTTTQEMYDAVTSRFPGMDVAIKAAAPADFTLDPAENKIKKTEEGGAPVLALRRTPDILAALGRQKGGRFLCGFAAETQDVESYALGKLERKNLDMIAANDVTKPGAGFDGDTNIVTLYARDGAKVQLSGTKRAVADALLDEIAKRL